MNYRVLAEHSYLLEAYVEAESQEEAFTKALKLSVENYEPLERTLNDMDELDNEDLNIINIELDEEEVTE